MSETPQEEVAISRFSTPDNELDDHRDLPQSLPPADPTHQRRGTLRSFVADRPTLHQINNALHQQGMVSQDNEHAIDDGDDKSDQSSLRASRSNRSRRESASPVVARRSTFRRPLNEEREIKSGSSISSRSESPPNSVDAFAVDAFAGRRTRPRAGTAGTAISVSPSGPGFIHRSNSDETHHRTRTLSHDKAQEEVPEDVEGRSRSSTSTEDDVCFPQQPDDGRPYTIDFDDLHEFVERKRAEEPALSFPGRKQSFSCSAPKRRLYSKDIPKITTEAPTPLRNGSETGIDGSKSDIGEKLESSPTPDDGATVRTVIPESVNRWSFFSSELEESIHAPELGDLLLPGETFKHLFELGPAGGCWWLDMLFPSEEEVEVICKAFGIHGLTREDIVEQETREKVELFKSYYFVCFRSFYQMDKTSERYMDPVTVYAVVFREGILTFTYYASPHASNVRKRMGKLRDYVALSADWICYALIDDIVDTFAPVIRDVEVETDSIEDGVFTTRPEDSSALLRQIGDCRKKVMSMIRLLGGKADVIKGFSKRCTEQFEIAPRREVGLYLSDVQDHVVTMMSNLNHFEKMLSRSHSNYLAQLNVTNLVQGNAINEVLGKVTFVATILVPLNLVCGLFGMNVRVPGEGGDNLNWWFGILAVILGCVAAAFAFARKKGLI